MHRFVVIDFSNVQHLLSWKIVTYCNLNAARQSPSQTDFWRTPWPAIEFKWQTNKISHDLHERGNIWKHPGSCSSSKHIFPATITLQPSLSHFLKKIVFFSPQGQTNTLTVLPVTAFASSVCQHGNCLSSKQYCETQRHNQSKRFHTYGLDFSLQLIPDLLTGLHLFGNIFSCWTRKKYNYITFGVLVSHIQIAHRAQLL